MSYRHSYSFQIIIYAYHTIGRNDAASMQVIQRWMKWSGHFQRGIGSTRGRHRAIAKVNYRSQISFSNYFFMIFLAKSRKKSVFSLQIFTRVRVIRDLSLLINRSVWHRKDSVESFWTFVSSSLMTSTATVNPTFVRVSLRKWSRCRIGTGAPVLELEPFCSGTLSAPVLRSDYPFRRRARSRRPRPEPLWMIVCVVKHTSVRQCTIVSLYGDLLGARVNVLI